MSASGKQQPGILMQLIVLVGLAACAALIISLLEQSTRQQIAENQARHSMALVTEALPGIIYDNEPALDTLSLSESGPSVYLARNQGEIVAVVLPTVAGDGYAGPIKLLIGIDSNGKVLRVIVSEHRETPGLGDKIESAKSDWIFQFDNRLNSNTSEIRLRTDGGDIDQITGATITSRSLTRAVNSALEEFSLHADQLKKIDSSPAAMDSP